MRSSHARRFVPGVYDFQLRNARAYVSCTRSSASSRDGAQMARDAIDLVGKRKRFLLEADAIPRLRGKPRRVRRCLGHDGHRSTAHPRVFNVRRRARIPRQTHPTGTSRKPPSAIASSSASRLVLLVVPDEGDLAHQVRVGGLEALVAGEHAWRDG